MAEPDDEDFPPEIEWPEPEGVIVGVKLEEDPDGLAWIACRDFVEDETKWP